MAICPAGHTSAAEDYCDLCGLPVTSGPDAARPARAVVEAPTGALCPHCGTNNAPDALFCEACGYDFTTGTMPRSATPAAAVPPTQWSNPSTPDGAVDGWPSVSRSANTNQPDPRWSSLSKPGEAEDREADQIEPDPRRSSLSRPREVDEAEAGQVEPGPRWSSLSRPQDSEAEAQDAQPDQSSPGAPDPAKVGEQQSEPNPTWPTGPRPDAPIGDPTHRPAASSPADLPAASSPADLPAAASTVGPAAPIAQPTGHAPDPAQPTPSAPAPTPPSRRPLQARPTSVEWVAEIWIDPDWYATQGATDALPSPGLPEVVPLRASSALIGRTSQSRNIHPDIDCALDSGVSRRHAQVTSDGTRWWIEDLESANGTFIGSSAGPLPTKPIGRGRVEFSPDQRIYLGGWTRIVIRAATDDEKQAFNA